MVLIEVVTELAHRRPMFSSSYVDMVNKMVSSPNGSHFLKMFILFCIDICIYKSTHIYVYTYIHICMYECISLHVYMFTTCVSGVCRIQEVVNYQVDSRS